MRYKIPVDEFDGRSQSLRGYMINAYGNNSRMNQPERTGWWLSSDLDDFLYIRQVEYEISWVMSLNTWFVHTDNKRVAIVFATHYSIENPILSDMLNSHDALAS